MKKNAENKKPVALGGFIKIAFAAFVIYAVVNIVSVQVTLADKREQLAALEAKKAQVKELAEKLANAKMTFFVDYKGITVDEDKDLRKAIRQSDGSLLNPFQQAKKYIAELPLSRHPKYVVTCNFKSFF